MKNLLQQYWMHGVAHSYMMQTQTFIQVCSALIEQSWRSCWTGFRFPGVQWIVPSPLPALFLFSWLVIYFSHLHTENRSSSQDPLLLAIVSRVVNQVFFWLSASFTHAGFHCSQTLARRPGNQQVHQQVCLDEDKAYWLATAAPWSSKLAVWTVVLWGRFGTAQSVSFTQTKTHSVVIYVSGIIVVFLHLLADYLFLRQMCVPLWLGSDL